MSKEATIAGTYVKECGCVPDGVYVQFCTTHAAAPLLAEACEALLNTEGERFTDETESRRVSIAVAEWEVLRDKAIAALRAAGKE